jgi:hydroxymethylbilane synthase
MLEGDDWKVLTHKNSQSPIGEVIAAYEHKMKPLTQEQIEKLETVTHAWWSSYPQFEAYLAEVPELKNARHFCGLGKTMQSFKQNNIEATALTDSNEFLLLTGLL